MRTNWFSLVLENQWKSHGKLSDVWVGRIVGLHVRAVISQSGWGVADMGMIGNGYIQHE